MSRLALRVVRTDDPPRYRALPGRLRSWVLARQQERDRARDVASNMRLIQARVRVITADDYPGNELLPGATWSGRLSRLPEPLREKARRELYRYYVTAPRISDRYPWTPLPGDPRWRVTHVQAGYR